VRDNTKHHIYAGAGQSLVSVFLLTPFRLRRNQLNSLEWVHELSKKINRYLYVMQFTDYSGDTVNNEINDSRRI